jgi:hypothetical protein
VQLGASVRAWLGGRGDEPVLIGMIEASVDVSEADWRSCRARRGVADLSAQHYIWERSAKQSRPTACGWMGHYDGMTVEQMDALRKTNKLGLKEAFFLDWLELFRRLGPEMAPQTE